ncbi:DUF262 domain-containing protein [Listeria seeligeri]|uniref:GmrSD restriction endonucleases N-terminal domain-containing protein n=2 Tax=Listeria seeligeri TaxID=1640 RepID=A0ABR5E877_LISSE|nr:DUF262 domain-containing protein [Listeria seeligeri]EFS01602.1 conserved hypothetical protein [Listeria seeligeri FSL N1-067]KKD46292.1 hypothetical protein UQ68_07430 [Listeria seeligeri]MBC2071396.1 DUF262 domain-containing protein [Listeria seeligeri]MBC2087316.1 DUF262 domain-containing protein [Listeria seeligeri]MBF2354788.1 DUF262 domain-containing protein [Listeria seeligeri]
MEANDGIELIKSVEDKIKSVRTRSLDLSFNELLDMYTNKELKIDPEYQRLFRWSEGKQSRFIESLLLELPVPPIFVIELEEGIYELMDGLQRISSYLNFRGSLESEALTLIDCDIVADLNGLKYEDLPKPLEIKLKRNFIRVEILRKESDSRLRYYMFKRLNTGGEVLSEQEVRNSTIRLLDSDFNNFLIELSKDDHFINTLVNLSDTKVSQKYDQELALRFLAFKNNIQEYRHDVSDFLTEYMEKETLRLQAGEFDIDTQRQEFIKTFEILDKTMEGHVFATLSIKGKPSKGFLVYHFEAFSLGIQCILDEINLEDEKEICKLTKIFKEIKKDSEFKKLTTGGGKNYKRPLEDRINFVRDKVLEIYE